MSVESLLLRFQKCVKKNMLKKHIFVLIIFVDFAILVLYTLNNMG